MLAGAAPFHAKAAMAFMRQHMVAEPPPLRSRVPEVSKELNELCHCMLAKEPQARPDMAQVVEQLRKIQSSSRYRDTLLVPDPPRRRPVAWWLAGVALAVVVLLGTLWLSLGRSFLGRGRGPGPGSPPGPALPAGPSLPGPGRSPTPPVPSRAAPVLPSPPLGSSPDLSSPRGVPPLPADRPPERERAGEPLDGGAPPDSETPEPMDLAPPRVDPEPSPPEPVEPTPNRHPPARPSPHPVAHPVKHPPGKPPAQRPEARHRGGKRGKRSHSR
jgi:hypothetical protein